MMKNFHQKVVVEKDDETKEIVAVHYDFDFDQILDNQKLDDKSLDNFLVIKNYINTEAIVKEFGKNDFNDYAIEWGKDSLYIRDFPRNKIKSAIRILQYAGDKIVDAVLMLKN